MEEEKQNYTREQLIVTLFDLYSFCFRYERTVRRAWADAELKVFRKYSERKRNLSFLDRLSSFFVSVEEEEQRMKLEVEREYNYTMFVIERKTDAYSRILDKKYWDPKTILDIRLYLVLNQAQTVEQAVELYEKGEKYKP